jgi:hypothetical protein
MTGKAHKLGSGGLMKERPIFFDKTIFFMFSDSILGFFIKNSLCQLRSLVCFFCRNLAQRNQRPANPHPCDHNHLDMACSFESAVVLDRVLSASITSDSQDSRGTSIYPKIGSKKRILSPWPDALVSARIERIGRKVKQRDSD